MKKVLHLFNILVVFFLLGCSSNDDYLEIDSSWFRKEWKLDGKIDDMDILGSKYVGTKAYWNEKEDGYFLGPTLEVSYNKAGSSFHPGQLTYGSIAWFLIDEDKGNKLILQRMNGNDLTYIVKVQFLDGESEGSYLLHVNYDGKNYELKGYPKD